MYLLPFLLGLGVALVLTACAGGQDLPTETPQSSETASVATIAPKTSPTKAPPKVLYYQAGDLYPELGQKVLATLQDLTRDSGMDLVVSENQPGTAELAEYQVAVLFCPEESLLTSIQAVSGISLVVIDAVSAVQGSQTWMIGDLEAAREQAAFLAGYVAALITPDWRAGAIGSPPAEGEANLLEAFVQGGQFFCGLCRPAYPPYYDYPVAIPISSIEADSLELGLAEAETRALKVLFLDEGVAEILGTLSSGNFQYLGLQSPSDNLRADWIATLRPAPEQALAKNWTLILSGSPVQSIDIPILIEDTNPELLTPGKLLLVQEIRDDLVAGFIQPIGIVQ